MRATLAGIFRFSARLLPEPYHGQTRLICRQNSLAKALSEMDSIEKTLFLVDYLADKGMRRRIHKGLNKGEAMNALAQAIFFGNRGVS